jgi:dihydroorotate dehydrogenase
MVRLPADRAAINRFGFNNEGMEAARARLIGRTGGVVGVNLGANKDAEDRAEDYGTVLRRLGGWVDFATVNVSSPNTEGLRDLQAREVLADLLSRTIAVRDETHPRVKLLVKISPDLTDEQIEDVAQGALETGIDGIVATNTTLSRAGLRDPGRGAQGGLSGVPLMTRSTKVLARLAARTEGRIVLVGVGGVSSGADAYAKIRAGASLVQLYTALAYAGPGLVVDIVRDLARLLERDGFTSIAQAVGVDIPRSTAG